MARPNKRQRENARLREDRANAAAIPADVDTAPRVPLAGFENLYEITRAGHVYSKRAGRFIQHAFFEGRTYIKLQVEGAVQNLDVAEAVEASWGQVERPEYVGAKLMQVTIPATTYVVYVQDAREANAVAIEALAEEVADGRVSTQAKLLTKIDEVPDEWRDATPYASGLLADDARSIRMLLEDGPENPPSEV